MFSMFPMAPMAPMARANAQFGNWSLEWIEQKFSINNSQLQLMYLTVTLDKLLDLFKTQLSHVKNEVFGKDKA